MLLKPETGALNVDQISYGHTTFNRNPYNGYINPYYWVDEFIPYYMEIMGVLTLAHIDKGNSNGKG